MPNHKILIDKRHLLFFSPRALDLIADPKSEKRRNLLILEQRCMRRCGTRGDRRVGHGEQEEDGEQDAVLRGRAGRQQGRQVGTHQEVRRGQIQRGRVKRTVFR